jgi:hypothetical protein
MLKNKSGNYKCACCGFYTLPEKSGNTFFTCPVCYWEDDGVQEDDPYYAGGANEFSLNKSKENFRLFGACNKDFVSLVRVAKNCELPDL